MKFIKKVEPASNHEGSTQALASKDKAPVSEGKRIGTGCIPVSGD